MRTVTPGGRLGCLGAAAFVATLCESPVRAQPAADAQGLFSQARELRLHGDCSAAVVLFRKTLEVYPEGLGSLRNIAECQEAMQKYASARHSWLDLKRALLTNTSSRYEGWSQDADAADARLAPKVPTLVADLRVVGARGNPMPASGIDVTINGEPLAPNLVGAALDFDPGRYLVLARGADGVERDEQIVDLAPGEAKHVTLRVSVAAAAPTSLALGTGGPRPATRLEATWRTAGWVAVGIGAASLVGAGVSLAFYQSAHVALDRRCPNYQTQPCDPSLQPIVNEGRTASTLFNVLGSVGLLGIGGGAAIVAVRPGHDISVALVVAPTGLSAHGTF